MCYTMHLFVKVGHFNGVGGELHMCYGYAMHLFVLFACVARPRGGQAILSFQRNWWCCDFNGIGAELHVCYTMHFYVLFAYFLGLADVG